jgi:acyl-CoA thioesterase
VGASWIGRGRECLTFALCSSRVLDDSLSACIDAGVHRASHTFKLRARNREVRQVVSHSGSLALHDTTHSSWHHVHIHIHIPRSELSQAMVNHPFADLISMRVIEASEGMSLLEVDVDERHFNPHRVVHGAVLYALADTGMGSALYPTLASGELCVTIEIKINYFKPVRKGELSCRTTLVNRGKTVANLEARVYQGETLVALANGNFAIIKSRL